GLVSEVLKVYLVKHKKKWDGREVHKIVGKTPLEAAAVIVEDYALPLSKEDFLSEFSPIWCKLKAQPGAYRLIKHLRGHGVKMALASNSPRANIDIKLSYHLTLKESFAAIVASDEVKEGKPSPEIYLEAAKRLNIHPSKCLVIEDSQPGICAAKAAKMEVVAVPSIPNQPHLYTAADEVIISLLDLRLETWGLPPFEDIANFPSLIHEDGELAEKTLELPLYAKYNDDEYFKSIPAPDHNNHLSH
ncbi:hypothetical protein M8C21_007549, partial [Ambrosia artemisiifolia]